MHIIRALPKLIGLFFCLSVFLVYPAMAGQADSPSQTEPATTFTDAPAGKPLPKAVAAMREAILKAARSGDLERLRPVIESNELTPVFSFGGGTDPIAFWKKDSEDGKGRTVLARMVEILNMPYTIEDEGTDHAIYIWPYLYSLDFNELTPAQEVDVYRLVPAEKLKSMRSLGSYYWYRLGISRDGTWQFFVAGD